jgi:hypothetical protein
MSKLRREPEINKGQADPGLGNKRTKRRSTSRNKDSELSCRMLIDDIFLGILFHPEDGSDTSL